ncbi:MAG: hypothetical protein NZ853_07555 [Leptospiraceae bacterium]|nr:hypothetical protein [Leptospiraceae bacterium]MDW7975710.1 hypothetical protein [Leptospiraceae bacterium]
MEQNGISDLDELKKFIEERNEKVRKERKRLINVSRIKDYIRKQKCEISEETIDAIDRKVYELINQAIYRTKANKRITIRPHDL